MKPHILPEFKMDAEQARNWLEDMQHENGNYRVPCIKCKSWFTGHKRRYICKTCAEPDFSKVPLSEIQENTTMLINAKIKLELQNLLIGFVENLHMKNLIYQGNYDVTREAYIFLEKEGKI